MENYASLVMDSGADTMGHGGHVPPLLQMAAWVREHRE